MKKFVAILLSAAMVLSLAACSAKQETPAASAPAPSAPAASAPAASAPVEEAGKYDSYPEANVTLIVPGNAGSNVDNFARIDAEYFAKVTGKEMIVENLGTGGGILGYETCRNAEADGYTLLIYNPSIFTAYYTGNYDYPILENFTPICTLQNKGGSAIVVRADSPYQTLEDLVTAAKEKPGTITFGIAAQAAGEFICKLLEKDSGAQFKCVDSGNNNDRVTAMLGGLIDSCTMNLSTAVQYEESGDFRVLAITDTERSPYAPDIPTCVEQGYANTIYGSQTILYGPANMDPEMVQRISDIFSGIMDDADAVEKSDNVASPLNFKSVADTVAEAQSQNDMMKTVADMLGYEYGKK